MKVDLHLEPMGIFIPARTGETIIKPIQRAGIPIGFSCRGQGVCTACLVRIDGSVSDISERESQLLGNALQDDMYQRRIACLAKIRGPLKIRTDYW